MSVLDHSMGGFGLSPFGASPMGGVGGGAPAPVGGLSPATAAPATAAKCRQRTLDGDYVRKVDGTTNLAEGDPVDEAVVFALRTVPGSFVDPSVGNGVVRITVNRGTADTLAKTTYEVNVALASLVSRGVIKNVTVAVAPYTKNGVTVLAYQVSYEKTGIAER